MKRAAIILLMLALLLLTACESRSTASRGSSSSRPASSQPASSAAALPQPAPPPEMPALISQPSSGPAIPGRDPITEPGLVNLARNIVGELLARAAVADEIYRAALKHDDTMEPMVWDGREYQPVIDERFFQLDDITAFNDKTFTRGGEATRRFAELQTTSAVYMGFNGELYVCIEPRMNPLTMGAWDIDTLELLLMEDREIEVSMQAAVLGHPEGVQILRIIRDGDHWLLGDSFFLD